MNITHVIISEGKMRLTDDNGDSIEWPFSAICHAADTIRERYVCEQIGHHGIDASNVSPAVSDLLKALQGLVTACSNDIAWSCDDGMNAVQKAEEAITKAKEGDGI